MHQRILGDTSPLFPGIRIFPENLRKFRGNSDRLLRRTTRYDEVPNSHGEITPRPTRRTWLGVVPQLGQGLLQRRVLAGRKRSGRFERPGPCQRTTPGKKGSKVDQRVKCAPPKKGLDILGDPSCGEPPKVGVKKGKQKRDSKVGFEQLRQSLRTSQTPYPWSPQCLGRLLRVDRTDLRGEEL